MVRTRDVIGGVVSAAYGASVRVDECEGPPNFKDLADKSGYGLNVNGSVCLNNVCMWANATLGNNCTVENTAYTVYSSSNESINIVSRCVFTVGICGDDADIVARDNCALGLYCDSKSTVCMKMKELDETCDADKECVLLCFHEDFVSDEDETLRCTTFNCMASGVCGVSADTPKHVPVWVYVVVGICIFGGTCSDKYTHAHG